MGMEHIVRFPSGATPELSQVMQVLADHNFAVQVRMVDGELTMPDEAPPARWGEVRLGTPSGMVTVVRRVDALHIVTWGNADAAMQRAWNAVAWAAAKVGGGQILGPDGARGPDMFRASSDFPEALKQ